MLRPRAFPRRVLGLALAASVCTGIGLGAYSLGSAFGADTPLVPRAGAATTTATAPARPGQPGVPTTTAAPAPVSSPLTLDEATAVAAQVAPGRVVEGDEDHEPTGLRYDVTPMHDDGSTTEVEVDAVTG